MKHIYLFYRKISQGLDPIFMAWTERKEMAIKFMTFRKGFYIIEKDVTDDDICELRNTICEKNEIIEYRFHTVIDGIERTVPMIATLREVYEITLHKESAAMKLLSIATDSVPAAIFNDEAREALAVLGYLYAMLYTEDLPLFDNYSGIMGTSSSIAKCSIDELAVFLITNANTIRDGRKIQAKEGE